MCLLKFVLLLYTTQSGKSIKISDNPKFILDKFGDSVYNAYMKFGETEILERS